MFLVHVERESDHIESESARNLWSVQRVHDHVIQPFHACRISFEGVKLVGLDVEWKPELLSGTSSPASLLQVSLFASNTLPCKYADMLQKLSHAPFAVI